MKQKIWSLEAGSDRSQLKRSDAEAKIGDAHLKKSANKCTAKANARTSLFVPLAFIICAARKLGYVENKCARLSVPECARFS